MENNEFIKVMTSNFSLDKEKMLDLISMSVFIFISNSCMKPCCCIEEKDFSVIVSSLLLKTVYEDTINKEEIAFAFYFLGLIHSNKPFKTATYYLLADILLDKTENYDSRVSKIRERMSHFY